MRIGFLAWNQFQVAQSAEIAKTFVDPDFIFIDRDISGLKGFNPAWLVPYGGYSRFVSELDLYALDGQYDAIVTQFRPPLEQPWRKTKLIIQQYSLAKPKTAYNSRWFSADHGLVYGEYSEAIIGQMCPVSQIGNPRFDPIFEGRLNQEILDKIREKLDPSKKTVVYQPTWGDLSTSTDYSASLEGLAREYNVVVRPHHMTSIKMGRGPEIHGVIDIGEFPSVLDIGVYLNHVADVIVSDMSGAIFDALYCGKSVVLIGDDSIELSEHRKADATAIEVSERHRIGPYVSHPSDLMRRVSEMLEKPGLYRQENERLVEQCFKQRGGCAKLAGDAIREAVEGKKATESMPSLQRYAAPDFNDILMTRTFSSAQKRKSGVSNLRARKGKNGGFMEPEGTRPQRIRATSFVKNKSFFAAGSQLEAWTFAIRRDMEASIYQAFNANSALRFSPAAWKAALARLLSGSHSPDRDFGKQMLQKIGMLKTVAAMYVAEGQPLPGDLPSSIETLGRLADFFDLAARNEVAAEDEQRFIAVDGSIRSLAETGQSQVVELYFALSIARELKDEAQRPYRSSQLKFAQKIFDELLRLGMGVYPRIQGGVTGVAPISANPDRVRFTWHTVDCGIPLNFHLKLGSLFGHFVIDDKGYSGWGSPAKRSLDSITCTIDLAEADAHWHELYTNLVEGSKSKYSQEEGEAPDASDYIFFPMQVVDDAVARLADIDTHNLLKALIEWSRSSGRQVVVKRHPMCKSAAIAETLANGLKDGDIIISNANIHRLIAAAVCVVTVNSGVGAEALLHLKPVVTTGGSDYAPATRRVRSVEELTTVLDSERWRSVDDDQIKKFLLFYTKRYMVEFGDRDAISHRIRDLFLAAGIHLPDEVGDRDSLAIAANDSDIRLVAHRLSPSEKRLAEKEQAYMRDTRRILAHLEELGVRYWLDGLTLSGFTDTGNIGSVGKSIHLGVLVSDDSVLCSLLRACAKSFGLALEERTYNGLPYAAAMKQISHKSPWKGPDLQLRYYYEIDDHAWSPQRLSLLARGAKYAKSAYRHSVSSIPASLREKATFAVDNPAVSASILLDAAGIGTSLRRIQKKQGTALAGRLLSRIFTEHLEICIPMKFLNPVGDQTVVGEVVKVPALLHEYLSQRYGWRNAEWTGFEGESAFVLDGFCSRTSRRKLDVLLCKLKTELAARKEMQKWSAPAEISVGEGVEGGPGL